MERTLGGTMMSNSAELMQMLAPKLWWVHMPSHQLILSPEKAVRTMKTSKLQLQSAKNGLQSDCVLIS